MIHRLSRKFGWNKECAHTRFTDEDIYTLKVLLDRKPTLYLSRYPREDIIRHFEDSFNPFANTDCMKQAHLRKGEIIKDLVSVIRDSMIYQFNDDDDDDYQDEKELEMYINSAYYWGEVMTSKNSYNWKECAYLTQKYYEYRISHKERKPPGESIDNAFIPYEGIPPSWKELGEVEEYEGEYEYPYYDN